MPVSGIEFGEILAWGLIAGCLVFAAARKWGLQTGVVLATLAAVLTKALLLNVA
ncbi:hypothetical protein [Plastoroseomonas hellenica]|uniref:Uncharacterized protein n=1 Tax=Plastoroseomonas hellenica TaxID=2687306 RepID=A0ABS5F6Y2_9PROT|nr:hypothetical protein [Plastoroseomonas hellenica]MBR0646373.1 hypothetical protein [Plastoroseomonas hellenica]MBR0668304.1 hypothetical protein [Plastoroseomonas hellenica]